MQHCSKEETLFRFFYNVSSSFFLLLIFIHYSSIFLAKVFHFVGSYPLIYRNQNEYDYTLFSEEEEEEEEEEEFNTNAGYFHENQYVHHHHRHHLVAEIIDGGDSLVFLHKNNQEIVQEDVEDDQDSFDTPQFSSNDQIEDSSPTSQSDEDVVQQHRDNHDHDHDDSSVDDRSTSHVTSQVEKSGLVDSDENFNEHFRGSEKKVEANSSGDEKFYVLGPTSQLKSRRRMNNIEDDDDEEEEIFGDSCTMGSTSKSSSEWRSSITYRESGMEDPFSSSSRRSCPKWESYTVFQKYDEEMMFLDRVSAQKLQETGMFTK